MEIFESVIDEIALSGLEGGISSGKCFLYNELLRRLHD